VWAGDITYIPTLEGWLYLAVVLDLGTRSVVGWAMRHTLERRLTCDALEMALERRCEPHRVRRRLDGLSVQAATGAA
jgi:putative transposase